MGWVVNATPRPRYHRERPGKKIKMKWGSVNCCSLFVVNESAQLHCDGVRWD